MTQNTVWRTLATAASIALSASVTASDSPFDEITTTAQRQEQQRSANSGNISVIAANSIRDGAHQHAHELLTAVAGTWISRGSGQESLPAIRSPVLTGAGSCGGFLMLEDGVPIRPGGFCNVNQVFELNTELASRIEVIRGPGTALYGSNALHGIVNVISPQPGLNAAAIEYGANDYVRGRGVLSGERTLGSFVYADDGGFRDTAGYRQLKVHASGMLDFSNSALRVVASATDLDQETAGFILGGNAYRDSLVNRSNPNPEAFRKADSQRIHAVWQFADRALELRPFVRRTRMEFLQHFLPGQPLEENGHVSAGILASTSLAAGNGEWRFGLDLEWSDVFLKQSQAGPTEGSAFLQETRPAGRHYDYDVTSVTAAPWLQWDTAVNERWFVDAGIRTEIAYYDYRNNMLDGNTRDDGSVCGFGGCLYSRPGDRSDTFRNLAPKIGLRRQLSDRVALFARLARGFRAPQLTELYRLQSGQNIADLDSEGIDSVEIGWRRIGTTNSIEFNAYWMAKRNSVLRDANGFNVSAGRSRHTGVEASVAWQPADAWQVRFNGTYARHRYDFDLIAARGESFVSGNDIDTAPRWMGSADVSFQPNDRATFAFRWSSLGSYFLDAENRFRYPGHDLVNLRASLKIDSHFTVTARLSNAFDTLFADRADYAFGNYRYFPGRGRELFVELRYQE